LKKFAPPLKYPPARRGDTVEDFHGTPVADPYRWLEDPESEESQAFTLAQNELKEAFLSRIPARENIIARLTELWNYPHYAEIQKKREYYFFTKNDGHQNQPVLYKQRTDKGEPEILIDPNKLSEDGTIAIMKQYYTKDGELLAYSLAERGSDWQNVHILDVDSGEEFEEVLQWTKFPEIVWGKDKQGFYYNRLPTPGTVPPQDQNNYRHVCWHTLGTPQEEDEKIFQHEEKTLSVYPVGTDDQKYLVLWVYRGTDDRNGLYYRQCEGDAEVVRLLEPEEAMFTFIGGQGDVFYVKTDLDAPRGRIVAIDLTKPERRNWREILPEGEDAIQNVRIVNHQFVVTYLHDAYHMIKVYDMDGGLVAEVPLPTVGTVTPLSGGQEDTEFFFSFASFLYPNTIFVYDLVKGELRLFDDDQGIDFNTDQYVTHQEFYASKDGTRVPMFLTYKKGIELNGDHPTILYGYGGFNLSQPPFFKVWNLVWLEMGGIFALANLRGGNEYGEEWHQAGMLDRKQNVFDDFHAAAEWLIEQEYTSTEKLAIEGRSNGGLLTAACMLQRPDLYGAVLCHVPVADMLRYHKFTLGHYWTSEYGNAESDPEHFKFMYAYSPLHNVKAGETYPPIIITTAETDDRVVPAHSKKFAATLQHLAPSQNPTLLRVETRAGHGLGKPIAKQIEERADVWAFLVYALGIET
jgi:prolyl oligopeptidase